MHLVEKVGEPPVQLARSGRRSQRRPHGFDASLIVAGADLDPTKPEAWGARNPACGRVSGPMTDARRRYRRERSPSGPDERSRCRTHHGHTRRFYLSHDASEHVWLAKQEPLAEDTAWRLVSLGNMYYLSKPMSAVRPTRWYPTSSST